MLPQLALAGVSSLAFCNARVSPPHSPAPLCKQHFWTCAKDWNLVFICLPELIKWLCACVLALACIFSLPPFLWQNRRKCWTVFVILSLPRMWLLSAALALWCSAFVTPTCGRQLSLSQTHTACCGYTDDTCHRILLHKLLSNSVSVVSVIIFLISSTKINIDHSHKISNLM